MFDFKKYILLFFFIIILFPRATHAQPSANGVIINEVMYNPEGADNSLEKSSYEWVELKNISSEPQDISLWEIRINTYFPLSVLTAPLPPEGFVVILSGAGTNTNTDFSQGNIAYLYRNKSGSQLGDSSGDISLYKSSSKNKNTIADFLAYGKAPSSSNTNYKHAADANIWNIDSFIETVPEDKSIELKKLSSLSESSKNWQESYILGGTPGKENSEKLKLDSLNTKVSDPKNNDEDIETSEPKIYSKEIRISELLPDPKGSDKDLEFIELENYSETEIDLTGWSLQDVKLNENQEEAHHKFTFTPVYCAARSDLCKVSAGKFFTIYGKDYYPIVLNNTHGDTIRLIDPENIIVNAVSYAEKKVKEDHAYAFDGSNWQWTSIPTPGEKNQFDSPIQNDILSSKLILYSSAIHLNEILPNATEEYIELYNNDTLTVDLSGWILRDASKRGKYIFPENTSVFSKSFLVITKKEFKFALNNSGEESVFLYNPREEVVSSISYTGSKKDVSYSFDGSIWRWTHFLTPGKENQFPKPLKVKITKPELVYQDIPASFKADILSPSSEKTKITWDFGDGRKSYQTSVRHTYENTGSYEVSVKVSGLEDFSEKFFVTVEDFPEIKVKISSFAPNPKGSDARLEYIEIKNSSKRKINLQNWSVATGWDKLTNHPIKKDFVIKPGESKKLTREFSNFTLNNKKSKIELRYPDGETAHSVKYKSAKTIADDVVYQKSKNKKKWEWIAPPEIEEKETDSSEPVISPEPTSSDAQEQPEQTEAPISENNSPDLSAVNLKNPPVTEILGYSQSTEWKEKKERVISLIDSNTAQITPAKTRREIINNLLSIKTVRAENENYLFTEPVFQESYAVGLIKNLGRDINYWLGKMVRSVL